MATIPTKRTSAVVLGAAVAAIATAVPGAAKAQPYQAYATEDSVILSGPSADYPPIASLRQGDPVYVYGCLESYSWCDVAAGSYRGWFDASLLDYYDQGQPVPFDEYAYGIGLPIVSFSIYDYWGHWYRDRPFFYDRERFSRIELPPPRHWDHDRDFYRDPRHFDRRPDFDREHRPDFDREHRPDFDRGRPDADRGRPEFDRGRADFGRDRPDARPAFEGQRPGPEQHVQPEQPRPQFDRGHPDFGRDRPEGHPAFEGQRPGPEQHAQPDQPRPQFVQPQPRPPEEQRPQFQPQRFQAPPPQMQRPQGPPPQMQRPPQAAPAMQRPAGPPPGQPQPQQAPRGEQAHPQGRWQGDQR